VEAAVDDFEITNGPAPVSVPDLAGPGLVLGRPRPSPLRDRTSIAFSLPHQAQVHLGIFDVSGRLVRTLVNARLRTGWHEVNWDARTDARVRVAPGVYYYRLHMGSHSRTQPLVVLR